MFDLLGAGLGLLGGLMGGDDEQTQTRQMDPRLDKYVYGDANNNGLLADAQSIYSRQMQTGGLNDMQRQGLDMQYQYLTSPQYMQGAQSMFNMGSSLMGGGVAGNPFTTGGMGRPMGGMGRPMGASPMGGTPMGYGQPAIGQPAPAFQFKPFQSVTPDYSVKPKEPPAVTESDFEKWLTSYLARQAKDEERRSGGG